jgi:hypothetical protein
MDMSALHPSNLTMKASFRPTFFHIDRLKAFQHAPANASSPVHFSDAAPGKTLAQ